MNDLVITSSALLFLKRENFQGFLYYKIVKTPSMKKPVQVKLYTDSYKRKVTETEHVADYSPSGSHSR